MDERQIVNLLSLHAEGLLRGAGTAVEPTGIPADARSTLEALFDLARRLKAVLVPVAPQPNFVAGLKLQLATAARHDRGTARQPRAKQRQPSPALWWVAGVGGTVAVIGVAIVGWRATRARRPIVSGIMGARAVPPTLPTAQPAP